MWRAATTWHLESVKDGKLTPFDKFGQRGEGAWALLVTCSVLGRAVFCDSLWMLISLIANCHELLTTYARCCDSDCKPHGNVDAECYLADRFRDCNHGRSACFLASRLQSKSEHQRGRIGNQWKAEASRIHEPAASFFESRVGSERAEFFLCAVSTASTEAARRAQSAWERGGGLGPRPGRPRRFFRAPLPFLSRGNRGAWPSAMGPREAHPWTGTT